jgi:hypothetical protein
MADWQDLAAALTAATGGDHGLDRAIAEAFAQAPAEYTESVAACRSLVAVALSGWKLHVGYGVSGLFPYAALSSGEIHLEAEAPTLPLAILRVAVAAKS